MSTGNGAASGLLKLDLGVREPYWLEIIPGVPGFKEPVELLVEPYNTRTQYAATYETIAARFDIKGMIEKVQSGEAAGSPEELAQAALTAGAERGLRTYDYTLALAKRVVKDWRGVGSVDSDEPLPFTSYHLELLFEQSVEAVQGFNMRYEAPAAALAHEKKVSVKGQNGITAAGSDTASAAGNEEPLAPAQGSEPPDSVHT